jgi:hypothetical protein
MSPDAGQPVSKAPPVFRPRSAGVSTGQRGSIQGMMRASSPASLEAPVGRWRNRTTGISFNIVDDGGKIKAASVYPPSAHESGYLRYSVTRDSLVIEHIETHPENGTGLGPLLMLFAARKAFALQKPRMSVVGLRYPDYYARWGFDIETPRQQVRDMYISAGREEDIPVVIGVKQADAKTTAILGHVAPYVGGLWSDEWAPVRGSAADPKHLTSFPPIG